MASSVSTLDGENTTVEETTEESFLQKIQAKFDDEVMEAFKSKGNMYFISALLSALIHFYSLKVSNLHPLRLKLKAQQYAAGKTYHYSGGT